MKMRIFVFVALLFFFTMALAIVQNILKINFETITLPQLGPCLAYFVMTAFFKKIFIPIKINFNKKILQKVFFCIFIPLILFCITYYVGKIININVQINNNIFQTIIPMIFGIVIGSIGEEIGWRSFFQPFLEKRYTRNISSIIVGIVWGLWHIGHYKNGPLFMACFLIFTISASILIAKILINTDNNIILSSLFHMAINIDFLVFFENNSMNIKLFLVNAIVWFLPIITILLKNKLYNKSKTNCA
jgi:membrane protease YdiL (CAAX protease family)